MRIFKEIFVGLSFIMKKCEKLFQLELNIKLLLYPHQIKT